MALIPANVILIYTGTHASIPDGYARETTLDGKYLKGNPVDTNPNDTGGALTHSHTSPAHSHSHALHVHSVSLNASTAGGNSTGSTSSGGPTSNHGHVAVNSGAPSGGLLNDAVSTYDAVNNEPPYYEVIFIKSDGSHGAPDGVIGLWDSATLPDNWAKCDGNNSTPNLTDKYLKGASTGANAGTTGGALTHTGHVITHTHTETGHTHARVQSGNYTATTDFETASGTADSVQSHSHDIDLDSNTMGYTGAASSGSGTNEPLHRKLMAIQNQNGQDSTPKGLIGMWLGTRATIPGGWQEVTNMNGHHLKITNTADDIYDIAGANTHTHSDSHSHSGGSHNHTATVEVQAVTNNLLNSGHSLPKSHGHVGAVGSQSGEWDSANTSADSANHEPPYRTVCFIKLVQSADAGFLLNFL